MWGRERTPHQELLAASTSPRALVDAARWASTRYVDPLIVDRGDQGTYLRTLTVCTDRLGDLGHEKLVRLVTREHTSRLKTWAVRVTLERLVAELDPPENDRVGEGADC